MLSSYCKWVNGIRDLARIRPQSFPLGMMVVSTKCVSWPCGGSQVGRPFALPRRLRMMSWGDGLGFYRAGDTLAAAAVGGVPSAAGLGHGVASLGGGAQFQNRMSQCFGIVHPLGGSAADE